MIQLPDINSYTKGGIVGFLLLLLFAAGIVIAWLAKNGSPFRAAPLNGPPRELTAGEKGADFWQRDFDARSAAQTKIIVEHLGKIRARLRDIDAKIVNFDNDVKEEFLQVRRDIAMLARAIEMRNRE